MTAPGRPVHVLAKPTGAICNLDCTYCFFLSKDALAPGAPARMPDRTLETYLHQLVDLHADHDEVTVAWQGDEPTLMGPEFFRRAVAIVEARLRPGQRVQHTIQTNGTLLDAEWAALFAEHRFLVGLSIDGPRELHDTYRVWKNRRGSHDDVIRAWTLLAAHGVDVNVLCCVHAANVGAPLEVYRYFRDELGARHLQLIPILERATAETLPIANAGWSERAGRGRLFYRQEGDLVTDRSVDPAAYGEFLVAIFEEWVRHDVGTVFVQLFDVTLGNHLEVSSLCVHSETCGAALALEQNGDLYSCDHYVEPGYRLGNVHDTPLATLVGSEQQVAFGRHKVDSLPGQCRTCSVRFACHGGCPKDRFDVTADGEPGLNHLCPAYLRFFGHTREPMATMASLLRAGRYADEIMDDYRRLDATTGRNEPCPCGSGRKFKLCHAR